MEISATLPFHVMIVAAGNGSRLGGDMPKQYRSLSGISVLKHTINRFLSMPGLQSLVVVISPDHRDLYNDAVKSLNLPQPVMGGSERIHSVANGLKHFAQLKDNDILLIHDAARPFIDPQTILKTVQAVHDAGAACVATRVSDTLKRDDGAYVERDGLWALQTPQGFHFSVIKNAHARAKPENRYSDDTKLVVESGHAVTMVEGGRGNFKITTPEDWALAEQLMGSGMETRTGTGFDVHAFDPQKKGNIRLCGIDIAHDHGLEGHSDADLGLHALTDALLGAVAEGDIGRHFPSSDPQWRNMDSAVFLKHAVDIVAKKGGRIVSLDLTLICEAPKVGPHVDAMRANVATICGIDMHRVSIKGTTAQKLGFTGRREGIAAQAVATVEVPRG
jgi:2-C-methyl-D-erythritol 4-phosphate cytidylyltransferase/2-C-methyl-D-erythritol 2,4-cyclodiphosphate synthase